jgi:hypothetical protein
MRTAESAVSTRLTRYATHAGPPADGSRRTSSEPKTECSPGQCIPTIAEVAASSPIATPPMAEPSAGNARPHCPPVLGVDTIPCRSGNSWVSSSVGATTPPDPAWSRGSSAASDTAVTAPDSTRIEATVTSPSRTRSCADPPAPAPATSVTSSSRNTGLANITTTRAGATSLVRHHWSSAQSATCIPCTTVWPNIVRRAATGSTCIGLWSPLASANQRWSSDVKVRVARRPCICWHGVRRPPPSNPRQVSGGASGDPNERSGQLTRRS